MLNEGLQDWLDEVDRPVGTLPPKFRAGMVFQLADSSTLLVTGTWGRGRSVGVDFKVAKTGQTGTENAARFRAKLEKEGGQQVRGCRQCGCCEDNCEGCIAPSGSPCHWVEADLCSACKASG